MIIVALAILFVYVVWLLALLFNWYRIPLVSSDTSSYSGVSVVVAFRNERRNLSELIRSLSVQDWPDYEVLLVDDHSSDGSRELASRLTKNLKHFRLFNSPETEIGKKAALRFGVKMSQYDTILFSDADCVMKPSWIKAMMANMSKWSAFMVCGPVRFHKPSGLFSRLLYLEQLSLLVTSASTWQMGWGTMCNGANILISKDKYQEFADRLGKIPTPSGDDEFLYHAMLKHYRGRVCFTSSRDSIVETAAPKGFKEFIDQRLRWSGKWMHYRNPRAVVQALLVFSANVSMLILLGATFLGIVPSGLFFIVLFFRAVSEFFFLSAGAASLHEKFDFPAFFIVLVLYPVYAVLIPLISLLRKYNWKDRKYK